MPKILVVEDNKELAAALRYNLEIDGHEVRVAADGPSGLEAARSYKPDLLILDLMLPGMDGFTVLERLRGAGLDSPVLILTARGEEADKVRGFRAGADQYLTKPFGLLELLERVKLLLRRWSAAKLPAGADRQIMRFGTIEIDPAARAVRRDGREVQLTPKAYDLLLALVRREGAVATRFDLLREVWGYRAAVLTRTVDAHIKELRKRLENDPANPRHVITVWKVGYRFLP